jgi:hypothetical protein
MTTRRTCSVAQSEYKLRGLIGQHAGAGWNDQLDSVLYLAFPFRPVVTFVSIIFPLKRLEITEIVSTTRSNRFNVVNFPSPLRRDITVLASLHRRTAYILSK